LVAAVDALPGLEFAGLLRRLRAQARLTQEELAKAARLSPRSVSDLEREIHATARKDTALLLATALGLTKPVSALFVAAARGRASAYGVLAALRDPGPRDPTLGRAAMQELRQEGVLGEVLAVGLPPPAVVAVDGLSVV
jgi:transcriptional regulator with XRE-family HTH domain